MEAIAEWTKNVVAIEYTDHTSIAVANPEPPQAGAVGLRSESTSCQFMGLAHNKRNEGKSRWRSDRPAQKPAEQSSSFSANP
jgi:hypothetical protein